MDLLSNLVNLFLHLDKHLAEIIHQAGPWLTYGLLFTIIFLETGVVIMPFLPGDSLLFAAGALAAATGAMNPVVLFGVLSIAAILGDSVNYWIGSKTGARAFRKDARFLNHEHLARTQAFYDKHGGKTIIIARFIPIVRTFAPFVAGVGTMDYPRFFAFNVFGGILWTGIFVFAGYFFGNIPVVKENFTLVILAIIFLSVIPPLYEYAKHRLERRRAAGEPPVEPAGEAEA